MTSRLPLTLPELSPSWQAELRLGFAMMPLTSGERTVLRENRHRGPLRVQKALYPEGDGVCQAIVLHPPSGIAGGDQLTISATVETGAHAQLTTPGAGKWYRSGGADASQRIELTVSEGATLEWLPQETIVFDGARARMETRVALAADSRFIGWDILCLGRAAAGERFEKGRFDLFFRVDRANVPLWIERGGFSGSDPMLSSPAGWAGATVMRHLAVHLPGICRSGPPACSKPCAPLRRQMPPITASPPCPACCLPVTSATIARPPGCGSPNFGKSCDRPVAVNRQSCPESGIPEESVWN